MSKLPSSLQMVASSQSSPHIWNTKLTNWRTELTGATSDLTSCPQWNMDQRNWHGFWIKPASTLQCLNVGIQRVKPAVMALRTSLEHAPSMITVYMYGRWQIIKTLDSRLLYLLFIPSWADYWKLMNFYLCRRNVKIDFCNKSTFSIHMVQVVEICALAWKNHQIKPQFCTCLDSRALLTCYLVTWLDHQQIEAETKLLPFRRWYFQVHSL